MKQKSLKIGALLLGGAMLFACGACAPQQEHSTPVYPVEDDDVARTQLYVYNSAYTQDMLWLNTMKERFEALHAQDTCWEDGKKGVQVVVLHTAADFVNSPSELLEGREEVYFAFDADVRALQKENALAEISPLVYEQETEERSVESKLLPSQKEYYGVGEETQKQYYALPDRFGSVGFVYNYDLFEEKGYFFAKDGTEENPFVADTGMPISLGADGKADTWDDGLPVTYDEFFTLCKYIAKDGNIPVLWGGAEYETYFTWLAGGLAAMQNGYEQTLLSYTLDGKATNLGVIKNGGFAQDEQATIITQENGYELARSAGNYHALSFIEELTEKKNGYYGNLTFTEEFVKSQSSARKVFVEGLDGEREIAMLMDGSWWQGAYEYATQDTNEENTDGEASGEPLPKSTRFGWMPLPKASEDTPIENTTLDCLRSSAFIKANVEEWKLPLAQAFLRFVYTDDALKTYEQLTGTQKAVAYGESGVEAPQGTSFAQSLAEHRKAAHTVYPYFMAEGLEESERFFAPCEIWRAAFQLSAAQQYPVSAFVKNNTSVVDYFNGMYKYRKGNWIEK
ncbi:MAG: hypothetical protein IJY34_02165 [Clostridia bacterium]|nr:hypothetical protein [Clostridia bacterium]